MPGRSASKHGAATQMKDVRALPDFSLDPHHGIMGLESRL